MIIVYFLSGAAIGALLVWLLMRGKPSALSADAQDRFHTLDKEQSVLNERISQVTLQKDSAESSERKAQEGLLILNTQLAEQRSLNQHLQKRLEEQKSDIENLQQRFTKEFENLANKILDEKSQKFTEQNRLNLDQVLLPLKDRIKEFELKVDTVYKTESAERNTLKGEIKNLVELNKQISEEASNLARALKGDSKKQGNWGEIILEKILERSGLVKGEEYDVQVSTSNDEGRRFQPDVVVMLPDNKHIIVDAKVSLVAYEAMVNAENEEGRERAMQDHLVSVRSHIRSLAEKNYQGSGDFTSPDFVLLFMPIESSFGAALQGDNDLFSFAWDRKIVIVSPSTLLATLRTIASIWKQERQTRNALEIARQGGALYDKFANFVSDLVDVGKKMDSAKAGYVEAMNKLTNGSGNILRRVEELKKLGAKATKQLPHSLIERAEENLES